MRSARTTGAVAFMAAVVMTAAPARAVDIVIDYSLDTTGIFAGNATARAALERAALDLSTAIISIPGAVTDTVNGTSGSASVTYDFRWSYSDPVSGATQIVADATLPANQIRIYAGWQNLTDSTLGQGGPGGAGFGASGSGSGAQLTAAVNNANAAGTANMGRGAGPVIGTLAGTLGGNPMSVNFGVGYGNIWFDSDTDNSGGTDTPATLAANWHFDHTTSVAGGKDDFYSVALHELIHVLGVGTSDTWSSFISGTNWTGAQAIAEHGTGTGLINGAGDHIASGIMSNVFGGVLGGTAGASQEVVMDPSITAGTRKFLTDLDLAFLRDLGWQTIPEPSTVALFGVVGVLGAVRLFRRRAA